MTTRLITFLVDHDTMFDMIAGTGDGGSAIGARLAEALLVPNHLSLSTKLGMAAYGITLENVVVVPDPPPPAIGNLEGEGRSHG